MVKVNKVSTIIFGQYLTEEMPAFLPWIELYHASHNLSANFFFFFSTSTHVAFKGDSI